MNLSGRKLIRYIYYFLLLASYFSLSFAQAPDTLWTRTYGGLDYDMGNSVQQTTDGGYIIAGWTRSFGAGEEDVYLIKTDANGDTLWTRTYGGADEDGCTSVQQTTDGGYILAGYTKSFGAGRVDLYLVKTDANGDTVWTKTYGGAHVDQAESIQLTSDDSYIIAGYTYSFGAGDRDVWLLKTDAKGDTLWTNTYGDTGFDRGSEVQQTTDGGYIIVGVTYSDIYLIKTDARGDTSWTRIYGGANLEYGWSVQQTSDGGYIITGFTESFGTGGRDVFLIKTNADGDTLWTRAYGGVDFDGGNSVHQTTDGGYIIAGWTGSFGAGLYDIYIIKTDSDGDTIWTKTYGGHNYETAWFVRQTSDEGYIVCGYADSDTIGRSDVWLLRMEPDTFGILESNTIKGVQRVQIYPNPARKAISVKYDLAGKTDVNISLFDVTGRLVKNLTDKSQNTGVYQRTINMIDLVQGVYFITLNTKEYSDTKKVILIK